MRADIQRVGIAYILIFVLAIAAVVRMVDLQYFHKPEPTRKYTRTDQLECTRGSILADDGRYLAFSIPEYRLTLDPCQPVDSIYNSEIDSLAIRLSEFYGDYKPSYYKQLIDSGRKSGKQYLRLNRKLLTYQQMKAVSEFPVLRHGRFGGGCMFEKVDHRNYPYGRLGYRTLGYIKHQDSIPTIGLEGSCDSVLRGKYGKQPLRLTEGNKWIPDRDKPTIPPIDGLDIQTTIDIDIQDMAQNALSHVLDKTTELHAGTVIVMDVPTGEVKAMVNLEKTGHGGFDETYNYAIGRRGEPGSVFKGATLTMLIDKGLVNLDTDMKAVVNWQYGKGKPFVDTYLRNYTTISIKRGYEISSNNVFRMQAVKFYGNKPQEFLDNLTDELHITKDFPFELKGFSHANLKSTSSRSWNMKDLPQIAMGYTVEITPLHTLNFYNAIANNGVMVRPHLIRNFQKDGVVKKEFPVEKLATICKKETAREVQKAMRGVVESEGGTGYRIFKDCPVNVAGKTGTAQIVIPGLGVYKTAGGQKMHQATFVGFFPYEAPRYSMIVVVYSELTGENFYGATWAGPVFREVAEGIYASSADWESALPCKGQLPDTDVYAVLDAKDAVQKGVVPDVTGMGFRDALKCLEESGYDVRFEGHGKVASQIPAAGDSAVEKKITLTLK